jgi:ubiquinone/menaquinone biosynthesis C-methylase UbiE
MVCAIDMFFGIKNPKVFLGERKRIVKKDGILIIDDGHQSRRETKRKIEEVGQWIIVEETMDHLVCKPM